MSINTRLAEMLPAMLDRHGFDATIQQRQESTGGDFDVGTSGWTDLLAVRAVWGEAPAARAGLQSGGPSSSFAQDMTIAFRPELAATTQARDLRVIYRNQAYRVLGISPIGDGVGLRLTLEAGTEAVA